MRDGRSSSVHWWRQPKVSRSPRSGLADPLRLAAGEPNSPDAGKRLRDCAEDASPLRRLTVARSLAARRLQTIVRSSLFCGGCARPPILFPPIRAPPATPERAGKRCRQACRPSRTERPVQLFPQSSGLARDPLHRLSSYFSPLEMSSFTGFQMYEDCQPPQRTAVHRGHNDFSVRCGALCCVAPLISNEFLSRLRQLALGPFRRNAMEVQNRLYSVFGFNLYRLVPRHSWLLNPDVIRPLDKARNIDVRFAANDDLDPVLASFHIGAEAYQW